MRCSSVADEREKLVRLMREKVVEWQNLEDSGRSSYSSVELCM